MIDSRGKLAPTWEGPYRVIKLVRGGTYRLKITKGKVLSRAWHITNRKKLYP
ncbi:hypothetical protein GW17_00060002 [Ensete ventricosum]|nr:hypothetical protein GW17_00060002 [Ensete ventricosum]